MFLGNVHIVQWAVILLVLLSPTLCSLVILAWTRRKFAVVYDRLLRS